MPAKSRRKRGKNPPPSKRIRPASGTSPAQATQPESEDTAPVPVAAAPRTTRTPAVSRQEPVVSHPFIRSELTTTGILALVIIVILAILSAIL